MFASLLIKQHHKEGSMGEPPSLTRGQILAVSLIAVLCLLLPFGYVSWVSLLGSEYYLGRFGPNAEFYLLALLPGAAAIIHHIVTRSSRHSDVTNDLARFRCVQQTYVTR